MKHRMLLALTLSIGLAGPAFALQPPVIPADPPPAKPADAKKKAATAKKPTAKPAAVKGSDEVIPLPAPEPAVVSQKAVVIRGQPKVTSEIIARLKKGDKVTVLEEIKTKKKQDEPDRWYKINIPTGSAAWVHSSFLDADKKVKPNKLNVRSGPSENHSVIARIDKGTEVGVIETKGEWSRVEPPASAYAYVAAHLVTREPAGAVIAQAAPPPPAPAPPPVVVVPQPPAVQPVAQPPVIVQAQPPVVTPAPPPSQPVVVPTVQPRPVIHPPPPEEPLVKRVVTREGIVKSSVSVQAPTYFVLRSLDNNKTVNYLFSPSTNIVVKDFKGLRVIVTGEEQLDERWPNTPVIEIETIKPVE